MDLVSYHLADEAALRYIGFTDQAASKIWRRFRKLNEESTNCSYNMMTEVRQIVNGVCLLADFHNDEPIWRGYMVACGLDLDFQNRLMAPKFDTLRLTQSIAYWVIELLNVNYRTFCLKLAANADYFRRADAEYIWSEHRVQENGFKMLWMGADESKVYEWFHYDGGRVRLSRLASMDGAIDLCPHAPRNALFLYSSPLMAATYCNYIHAAGKDNPAVCLVRIQVPIALLNEHGRHVVEEWQQAVWHSRLQSLPEDIPDSIKQLRKHDVLVGAIFVSTRKSFFCMTDSCEISMVDNVVRCGIERDVGNLGLGERYNVQPVDQYIFSSTIVDGKLGAEAGVNIYRKSIAGSGQ